MHRSSESIASLAGALAKAQAELTNPEKSLVATIRSDSPGCAGQTFRYAPLASGLDIVRKTLGQHEIAVVQTTAIDQAAGTVNLTTVLAHASGEWISSDWPVCTVADTASPQRMGAALTYARRYALFTLVGIAGEDDLDAPDLATPTGQKAIPERPQGQGNSRSNGGLFNRKLKVAAGRSANTSAANGSAQNPTLELEASAQLRSRLIAELCTLGSTDEAAVWAHRSLPDKNRLTASDAEAVEEAFRARLTAFAPTSDETKTTLRQRAPAGRPRTVVKTPKQKLAALPKAIDKSALALPEPRRIRDRYHVKSVAQRPCLICGRRPADAHHLRFAQSRALGRKVSDEFTVPLCRGHHREAHRCGDEAAWWRNTGIDPTISARILWLESHPLPAVRWDPERPRIPHFQR